jgi:hypothetical protein
MEKMRRKWIKEKLLYRPSHSTSRARPQSRPRPRTLTLACVWAGLGTVLFFASLTDGSHGSSPSSRSSGSSTSPKRKSEEGVGTRNTRGEIPFVPSASHACQATAPVSHASCLRSPSTHRAREADAAMAVKSVDTAYHHRILSNHLRIKLASPIRSPLPGHLKNLHQPLSKDATWPSYLHHYPPSPCSELGYISQAPTSQPPPTFSPPPLVASPLTASHCKEGEGGKKRRGKAARRSRTTAAAQDIGEEGDAVAFFLVGKRHCTAARLHCLESPLHRYPSATSPR